MDGETSAKPSCTDDDLRALAVEMMGAVHRSIDWDKVSPRTYWERMPAAFKARAMMATTYGQMVESLRRSLQIPQFFDATSSSLSSIGDRLADAATFRRFCRLVKDEAAYIAVEVRAARDDARASRGGAR